MKIRVMTLVALLTAVAFAERIELKTDYARCEVETVGARIVSLQIRGGEVLWNAAPAQTAADDWAHGGIPVCWPFFGKNASGKFHGSAWRSEFAVVEKKLTPQRCDLVLKLTEGERTLDYRLSLTDELTVELISSNRSKEAWKFSMGFHPYFLVGERDRATVVGATEKPLAMRTLDDVYPVRGKSSCAVYRLVDPVKDRTILVFADNTTDVNVWNPGPEKDCPGFVPGDEWRHWACVEPICGEVGREVTLAPGAARTMRMTVAVRKGAKTAAAYEGTDPRYPGFPEKNFRLPFKVVYLGAHPDDAEYYFGCAAARLVKAGAKVTFVSICNGDNGHQTMRPVDLAARRYRETQNSARSYGIDRYVVMGEHDCQCEPTLDLRHRVIRLIRDLAPNMVVCHRTCDYHADHRAAGQVVQDATYLLGVPLCAPESPVPENLPFVVYGGDQFTLPRPFRPDLVVDGLAVFDQVCRGLACHESQLFEWLPPEYGIDPKTLDANSPERAKVVATMAADLFRDYEQHRPLVEKLFGPGRRPVNVFELCEYSRQPCPKEIEFLRSVEGFKWVNR